MLGIVEKPAFTMVSIRRVRAGRKIPKNTEAYFAQNKKPPEVNDRKIKSRITSYNVCYTKLLRFLQEKIPLAEQVRQVPLRQNSYLLVGSPAYQQLDDGKVDFFNSAYLFSPQGKQLGRSDKIV